MNAGTGVASRLDGVALIALAAMAMGYGWGFRGDYGGEVGAMVPGALVAMAEALERRSAEQCRGQN